jgi:sugar O-acyltransferase (sialic acid O-acetyltransferase NeuD family)
MGDPVAVEVPLVNPNEPEAMVVELNVADGDHISQGQVICSLETSKSVEDVVAEAPGYVAGLTAKLGSMVTAGDLLCYLASDPEWQPPAAAGTDAGKEAVPDDLRITEPALAVARELSVDLDELPRGVLVTERHVREAAAVSPAAGTVPAAHDPTSVLIFGAGGHGKTLIELLRAVGELDPVRVVDDSLPKGSDVLGVPVVGTREELAEVRADGIGLAVNAIGGITSMGTRIEVTRLLTTAGFMLPPLIHPSAAVEPSARIGAGAQILAHSYVGSDAVIAEGVLVNTGVVVSHDCTLESHANLSPGCLLAGGVTVGSGTLLGMGVTTYIGIEIGADVRVGNAAILNASVPDGRRIRAGSTWDGEGRTA